MRDLTVVIPTYNEAENLPLLATALWKLPIPDLKILIVDDASPDGTGQIADALAERNPGRITVIHRSGKLGLGTAYITGFMRALEMGAEAVIAVDTGAPLDRRISTCLDALLQAQRVTSHHLSRLQLERAHARLDGRLLVLRPDVETIKMFDFNRGEEAVRAGIEAVHASLERIRAFCKASSR